MATNKETLTLAVETVTRGGSAAVLRDDRVRAHIRGEPEESASALLLVKIDEALRLAGIALPQIDLLAAAVGPGSFTGLRVGLSTVKALSTALELPVVGVETLRAIAHLAGRGGTNIILFPAGRGEYFAQLWTINNSGLMDNSEITHESLDKISERLQSLEQLQWIMPFDLHDEVRAFERQRSRNSQWTYRDLPNDLAVGVGQTGLRQWRQNDNQSGVLRPVYVRAADIGKKKSD